ncbi:MAG: exodeoxyribonuclease VII small subunit [Caldimicrobium sp.]
MKLDYTFETALKKLEEIIKALEEKDLDLEKALTLFEEGLILINFCEEKLKQARQRVEIILKGKEGYYLESLEKAKDVLKNGKS